MQVYLRAPKKTLDNSEESGIIINVADAALAHPVERHLAKVEVASSSLVSRSIKPIAPAIGFLTIAAFCRRHERVYPCRSADKASRPAPAPSRRVKIEGEKAAASCRRS